jgi:hypothetical protein
MLGASAVIETFSAYLDEVVTGALEPGGVGVLFQPIYENDRIDPVDPTATLSSIGCD